MQLQTTFLSKFFHADKTLKLRIFVTLVLNVVIYRGSIFIFSMTRFAAIKCFQSFVDFVIYVVT